MKKSKNLTFAALAALVIALLFQAPITRAGGRGQKGDDNPRGDHDRGDAKATFTKWMVDFPPCPGVLANMAGVVGGDVGEGTYTGEYLFDNTVADVSKGVALYHFHGTKHAFTALLHVEQTGFTVGSKAVLIGVVTDGWLKGHAVKGEYTVITCEHVGVEPLCYEGTLKIGGDSND
jgi:hypothetical protein